MCGIAGYYNPNGHKPEIIQKMADIIAHRGPDDSEYSYFDNLDSVVKTQTHNTTVLALGHRRLSIVDLSTLGQQPMRYAV